MELYEITLQPKSGFGTPLKGDTIFGHFCWQAANDPQLLNMGLEKQVELYSEKPFAVFSSAYVKKQDQGASYFFKRPDVSLDSFEEFRSMAKKEKISHAKEMKKKKWMETDTSLQLSLQKNSLYTDKELLERLQKKEGQSLLQTSLQPHNSVNRLTNTTGTGMFAPYSLEVFYFLPDTELALFVLLDSEATDIERVISGLERMGKWGFGKDATAGMGKFNVAGADQLTNPDYSRAEALYTLAPSVPETGLFKKSFFSPFVRFGKHGDMLASKGTPFKNPVIMADEGAVFVPEHQSDMGRQYIGRAVSNVSKAMPKTVVQGYSPVLPIHLG